VISVVHTRNSSIGASLETNKSFLSVVKKARIAENGEARYVDYEIVCQFRVVSLHVQKEVIHRWSVWKRYSEFEALHRTVKKTVGKGHFYYY
jgi:hypothetical protein